MPGFGHPLYRNDDPRALAILPLLPPDPTRDAMRDAMDLIRGKQPNVDFALAVAAGLPGGRHQALDLGRRQVLAGAN